MNRLLSDLLPCQNCKIVINFEKLDISLKKSKKSRKSRGSTEEEDEGFEEGLSSNPYVKMNQISSREYLDQLNELQGYVSEYG